MTRQEIINKLESSYRTFADFIISLNDRDFMFAPAGKWTAGQQLDHLVRSVQPLPLAFRIPKFLLRFLFGRASRGSKDYENLVKKYLYKLEKGGRASGRFIPSKKIEASEKQKLKSKLLSTLDNLCRILEKYPEKDLDKYVLPHPLLGKVTLREMLYFTIYHVEHHQKLTLKNLSLMHTA